MKRLSDQTLYEILEVSVEAPPEEIERAYARASALYGPGSLATYSLVSADEAALLNNRIEEAKAVLLDPDARGRYDERIGVRPRAAPPPPPPTHGVGTPWPPAPVVTPVAPPAAPLVTPTPAAAAEPPAADEVQPPPPAGERARAWGEEPAPPVAEPASPAAAAAPAPEPEPTPAPAAPESALPVQLPISLGAPISTPPPGAVEAVIAALEPAPVATPASPGAAALTTSPSTGAPVPPPPIPLKHELPAPRELLVPEGAAWTGEMLRQVREARGLTVSQLSERTKVTRHHLENIEADRFGALPAPVYLRGILMSLARELRLDGQKVARSYLERQAAAAAEAGKK